MTAESDCKAKSGCKWEREVGACTIRREKSNDIAVAVAQSLGSSYAPKILSMFSQCSGYTSAAACTAAKTNAAAAVAAGGSAMLVACYGGRGLLGAACLTSLDMSSQLRAAGWCWCYVAAVHLSRSPLVRIPSG
jgi:hypothetical protein